MIKKILLVSFVLLVVLFCFFIYAKDFTSVQISAIKADSITVIENNNQKAKVSDNSINYELSNSIFYQKANIKLNVNDDTQVDLIIKPKDKGSAYKYIPLISLKNLKINGNTIEGINTKSLSDKNPLVYSFDVKKGENIDISFKHTMKIKFEDYQDYISLSILMIIISVLYLSARLKNIDIIQKVKDIYNGIDTFYKKVFLIVFLVLNFAFIIHTITFMWGNHDWLYAFKGINLFADLYLGRYSPHIIKTILFGGQYIPFLSNIVAFIGFTLTAIFLLKYWGIEKKLYIWVICGILLTVQPFTLEWLYYTTSIPEFFWITLYVVIALMLSEKSIKYLESKEISKFVLNCLISILLLNLAISSYPSVINAIGVIFLGRILIDTFKNREEYDSKKYFQFLSVSVGCSLVACILFKLVLCILKSQNKLLDIYAINQADISQLPMQILNGIMSSLSQLVSYKFPFMPNIITISFAILLAILILLIIKSSSSVIKKLVQISLIAIILIGTKVAAIIAAPDNSNLLFFCPRIDFYGLLYFRILIVAIILNYFDFKLHIKNIVVVLTCFVICVSVINDLNAQKVWKLGFESSLMEYNRIMIGLENNSNFDVNKKYDVIQFGAEETTYREMYYNISLKTRDSYGMLSHSYDQVWAPFQFLDFYYPNKVVKSRCNSLYSTENTEFINTMQKLKDDGVFDILENSKDKIVIHDDKILYVKDLKELKRVKELLK